MKRLLTVIASTLCLLVACSKQTLLSPAQFTKEYAEELRKAAPDLHVAVVKDLELKVTAGDGRDYPTFLDNAYDSYKLDPTAKSEVIKRYVSSGIEVYAGEEESLDESRIVPIIKDAEWLEETRQAMRSRGEKKEIENVYDDYNGDLLILYAVDTPTNIRYLTPSDIDTLKMDRTKLKQVATANLRTIIPQIERHGNGGVFMLSAGGNYEASLLLIESLWSKEQFDVPGEIVVAIPTRDLLLVTGSGDAAGVAKVRTLAKKSYDEGSYRLTPKLFVRRGDTFRALNN